MSAEKIYSVTEITREIKRAIHESFGTMWIEGEISGYKRYSSGHHYFTLKDAGAQIPCTLWKMYASRLTFSPEDGMKVQVWGNLDVYEQGGRYQFSAMALRPAGVGELQRAYEALLLKLRAEGLFDPSRKKPLPRYPESVGIVTSREGAVLQDMLKIASRRWPCAQLILAPVRVQGDTAAEEISEAIRRFNRIGGVDVLIVGRGGGSLEDLWAFNEEPVARAIFASRIPVVSAVGHEVDFTIADFVADLRAPTPSAAMELVLPDREQVAAMISDRSRRLTSYQSARLRELRHRVSVIAQHWALKRPINLIHLTGQRLDDLRARMESAYRRCLMNWTASLTRLRDLATAYRPQAVLERGYAIVRTRRGEIVRDSTTVRVGEDLQVTFARGQATVQVGSVSEA